MKHRRAKTPRRYWSAEEIAYVQAAYPTQPNAEIAAKLGRTCCAVTGAADKLGLKKTPEYLAVCYAECGRKAAQNENSIRARIQKGNVPKNKGVLRPGWAAGRMRETQFRKGNRPHNYHPVGAVLTDGDGYVRIKARERQPGDRGGWDPQVWPPLHHEVWRKHHGAIPAKHMVVFRDKNRQNCAIENLELISMAENAHRNRMWGRMPRELAEAIHLNGQLKRKIRGKNGKEQNDGPSRPSVRDTRSA